MLGEKITVLSAAQDYLCSFRNINEIFPWAGFPEINVFGLLVGFHLLLGNLSLNGPSSVCWLIGARKLPFIVLSAAKSVYPMINLLSQCLCLTNEAWVQILPLSKYKMALFDCPSITPLALLSAFILWEMHTLCLSEMFLFMCLTKVVLIVLVLCVCCWVQHSENSKRWSCAKAVNLFLLVLCCLTLSVAFWWATAIENLSVLVWKTGKQGKVDINCELIPCILCWQFKLKLQISINTL